MAVVAPVDRYGPATLRVMFSVVRADGATLRTVDDEKINGRMYRLHDTGTVSKLMDAYAQRSDPTTLVSRTLRYICTSLQYLKPSFSGSQALSMRSSSFKHSKHSCVGSQ